MSRHTWDLPRLLSPVRMAPYLSAVNGSWNDALELYDWNTKISSAFFESLHYVEVGLRNAVDVTVARHVDPEWLTSASLLTQRSRRAVSLAADRAGGQGASHGKVVAELPFGFWWSLLADEYNRRLWQPALRHGFEGPVRRRVLHAELDELRKLRNRIAHHEPIHSRPLQTDFARLLDVASRISHALGVHIEDTSRVPATLHAR